MKFIMKVELTLEDYYIDEERDWLQNDILKGYDTLTLHSFEIGDILGEVKVLEIEQQEQEQQEPACTP